MNANLIEDIESWKTWSSHPSLTPLFKVQEKDGGKKELIIAGDGNPYCIGKWFREIPIEGGKTYRFKVRFRVSGIIDLNLHILNTITWIIGKWSSLPRKPGSPPAPVKSGNPPFFIEHLSKDGKHVVGEQVFTAPKEAIGAELGILLRYAAEGKAVWENVEISEDQPLKHRLVKVATIAGGPPHSRSQDEKVGFWADVIDEAAESNPDLILLPEGMNYIINKKLHEFAEPIPGPTYEMLSRKAREHRVYLCGCFYEKEGDYVFNAAVLMDREGKMVGKYRKVHPHWRTETERGCTPGNEFPVFKTDFGTIGIIICNDSWFSETSRILALKGADIILFPNAGYGRNIMPARARDNNIYLVVASVMHPALIMNTNGDPIAETPALAMNKIRDSVDVTKEKQRVITATIDLDNRPIIGASGTLNAPNGGRRATRNSRSLKLYQEILREIAS